MQCDLSVCARVEISLRILKGEFKITWEEFSGAGEAWELEKSILGTACIQILKREEAWHIEQTTMFPEKET